jgi:CRP-like cAMP-binding protein
MNENCTACKVRTCGFFCQLPMPALKDLDDIKFISSYPKDATLFMENQTPRGIYILCEGELKLSVTSSEGKTLIMRISKPGEVLGLMATMANVPYEVTAETLRPCRVAFVRREAFLQFLTHHPEAYAQVVAQMGHSYQAACVRTIEDDWAVQFGAGKAGETAARLCGARAANQRRHPHPVPADARGNRRVHRDHARNGFAHDQRIQERAPDRSARIDARDPEPRGPGRSAERLDAWTETTHARSMLKPGLRDAIRLQAGPVVSVSLALPRVFRAQPAFGKALLALRTMRHNAYAAQPAGRPG